MPDAPLTNLNTTTGALLIGTWANSFLYMAELAQARYYFRHFKHDDWKLKTLVMVAFLVDTASTLGDYACVYLYTVTHANDNTYLENQHWPIPLYLFTTAVIAVLVQGFLIVRYWWFTRNILFTLLNFLFCLVAFGGAVACGVIIALHPEFKERGKVRIPATIWLVCEAVADLSIAAALLWEFRKARPMLRDHQSDLDRLVALTVRTGTATAALAVATVIAFLQNDESNVSVAIAYALGRVYMLSMLANLNVRRSGRTASNSSDVPSPGLGSLTIPSIALTDEFDTSDDFPTTMDNGAREYLTFAARGIVSCDKSLGEGTRAHTETSASHGQPPRKSEMVAA
ncbi:hypothetical protein FB45DRAFT_929927 [Roridomyces roridus]|uniref:DUF6534 domain-containing protein n=1 Tax=Roridomyces roridus TaxID=1738132 RepID=A0AAD7BGX7_9AGAR|nr:hypothetical protein FB45DRAFT_929927 [Roridomyces roridus]